MRGTHTHTHTHTLHTHTHTHTHARHTHTYTCAARAHTHTHTPFTHTHIHMRGTRAHTHTYTHTPFPWKPRKAHGGGWGGVRLECCKTQVYSLGLVLNYKAVKVTWTSLLQKLLKSESCLFLALLLETSVWPLQTPHDFTVGTHPSRFLIKMRWDTD